MKVICNKSWSIIANYLIDLYLRDNLLFALMCDFHPYELRSRIRAIQFCLSGLGVSGGGVT